MTQKYSLKPGRFSLSAWALKKVLKLLSHQRYKLHVSDLFLKKISPPS
jgi:hypothetical protein